jgi:hypothetical protein
MSFDDCECDLWQTAPERLQALALPPRHCAWCRVCGAAGHRRGHPSGFHDDAWCDRCHADLPRSSAATRAFWLVFCGVFLVCIAAGLSERLG